MSTGNPSKAYPTLGKEVTISLLGLPVDEVGHMFNAVCQMEAQGVLGPPLVWYSLVSSETLGLNYLGIINLFVWWPRHSEESRCRGSDSLDPPGVNEPGTWLVRLKMTIGKRYTRTMTEKQGFMVRATRCGKTCKVEVSRLTGKPRSHGVEFPAKRQLSRN